MTSVVNVAGISILYIEVFDALFALKKFNYKNIYSKSMRSDEYEYYRKDPKVIEHIPSFNTIIN